MVLNQFNGGLSILNSPSLININESVICDNVNTNSISLKAIKGNVATAQNFGSNGSFIYFNGQWINKPLPTSFVEFNGVLYYTEGTSSVKKNTGIVEYQVGINKPSSKLNVVADGELVVNIVSEFEDDTLPEGKYTYLIVGYKDGVDDYITKYETEEVTDNFKISISLEVPTNMRAVVYRRYDNVYRYLGEVEGTDTIVDTVLDIQDADTFDYLSLNTPAGTIQYCYTYYREADGTESAPSEYSDATENTINSFTITNFLAPTDASVSHIRLYRLGGNISSMALVAELPTNTTSYQDTEDDDAVIVSNGLLDSYGLIKPPTNLNHLTEHLGTLWGSDDNILYFSEPGLVDRWRSTQSIIFTDTITGIGSTQNGLLVFTRNKTWIITGDNETNYTRNVLSDYQGCIGHKTIKYINNTLIWLSLDGICGSTGSAVDLLSKFKLGKVSYDPITSMVYDEAYYLFHTTGTLVLDMRNGMIFKTMDLIVNGAYYSSFFDTPYFLNPSDGGMYELGTSNTLIPYTYRTGYLASTGLTGIEIYKNIYIFCEDDVTLNVYLDGNKVVADAVLTAGFNDILLPSSKKKAYYAELEFKGTGTVYEVEFKTEGRQNGR